MFLHYISCTGMGFDCKVRIPAAFFMRFQNERMHSPINGRRMIQGSSAAAVFCLHTIIVKLAINRAPLALWSKR